MKGRRGRGALGISAAGQLNGIAVRIFSVAESEPSGAAEDFSEAGAAFHQGFAERRDVCRVEGDFRAFAPGRCRAGVQRDARAAGVEFAPAFLVGDLREAEHLSIEPGHRFHLWREQDDARHIEGSLW